jgi:hypothetical protein
MKKQRIIFLDIDGVLNCQEYRSVPHTRAKARKREKAR